MDKTVDTSQARRQPGNIRNEVAGRKDHDVHEFLGEPVAAVAPMAHDERWQQRRAAFFDRLEEMAATANLSPDVADELAAEAVRVVRRELGE